MSVADDAARGSVFGPVGAIFSAAIGGLTGKREGDPGGVLGRAIYTSLIVGAGNVKRFVGTISADDARALSQGSVSAEQIRIKYGQQAAPAPPAPPVVNAPVPYEPPRPPPWNPGPINRGPPGPPAGGAGRGIPVVGVVDLWSILEQLGRWNDLLTGGIYTGVFGPAGETPKGPPDRKGPAAGRGDPFPPQGSPPQNAPPAETVAEARQRKREDAMVGMGDIYVNPRRIPMPAPVPPTPPAPVAAPALPKWAQLLQLGLPLLGPLLGMDTSNIRLSQDQSQTQPDPLPEEDPLTGFQPEVANYYGGDFGGGAVGTNTCECKPPRKKRRKKKRKVCYTGRFTEGFTGTSKYSKREVPCK